MTRDLASCRECVFAYHAAREADADSDYGHRLFDYDVDRLISSLRERLALPMDYDEDDVANEGRLHTMLAEILSYPEYLLDDDVARLFELAFEEYDETNDEELEAEENFAGLYLLLVHPSYKVCTLVIYLFRGDWFLIRVTFRFDDGRSSRSETEASST